MFKKQAFHSFYSVMIGTVLMLSFPLFADESSLPAKPGANLTPLT